jgi:predicted acyl esterase
MRMLMRLGAGVLVVLALGVGAAQAATPQYAYVKVSDGTEIAVSIWFPPGYHAGERWPAIFEMDGYGGARQPDDTQFAGRSRDFIVVYASLRGTGCSGGTFDLFSQQGAQDGYDVIEHWLVRQPWSDGRVGIAGHSYSGLTGFLVAETAPPHVKAVALSGLIDDFYRGILYMGGVPNAGFPLAWGAAARPASELQGNGQPQLTDDHCRQNFVQHQGSDYVPPPTLFVDIYGTTQATPDSWAIQRSLIDRVKHIRVPTQIGQQYQDEQTGPRGGYVLWQHLRKGLPKRLVLSNGRHNPNDPTGTKDAWLRCWVIQDGHNCDSTTDPHKRVLMHFESRKKADGTGQERATPYTTSDFPARETVWKRWKLDPRTYVSTSADDHMTANTGLVFSEDQGIGGVTFAQDTPTQARWALPFTHDAALSGPIDLTLRAAITAPDTDFFVDLLDHDTQTGELRYLQRGMLRASFRELDRRRSDRVRSGPHRGEIWRPYHPFVHPQLVTPGRPETYEIEIFPLGHIFRAGHELVLQLHAPPPNDPLSIGAYPPEQAPAAVQVLDGTSVLLPFLPVVPKPWATPPDCSRISGELCLKAP